MVCAICLICISVFEVSLKFVMFSNPHACVTGYQNDLRVLYSTGKIAGTMKKLNRYIPQVPERILDAPDIINDYCEYVFAML